MRTFMKPARKKAPASVFTLILVAASLAAGVVVSEPTSASAVAAADFHPGNIINDAVFTNKNSMSVQQIQDFLNARYPRVTPMVPKYAAAVRLVLSTGAR